MAPAEEGNQQLLDDPILPRSPAQLLADGVKAVEACTNGFNIILFSKWSYPQFATSRFSFSGLMTKVVQCFVQR